METDSILRKKEEKKPRDLRGLGLALLIISLVTAGYSIAFEEKICYCKDSNGVTWAKWEAPVYEKCDFNLRCNLIGNINLSSESGELDLPENFTRL